MNSSLKSLAALALVLTLSACGPAIDLGGLARSLSGTPAATGATAGTTTTAEQDGYVIPPKTEFVLLFK